MDLAASVRLRPGGIGGTRNDNVIILHPGWITCNGKLLVTGNDIVAISLGRID
jgi:hypothetical protein